MDRTEEQDRLDRLDEGPWEDSPNYAEEITAQEQFLADWRRREPWLFTEQPAQRGRWGEDGRCFDRDAERGTWRTTAEMPPGCVA